MSEELTPPNQEVAPETPPVETAGDLGEVAVGEGTTPTQIEDVRLAHEMADVEAPVRQMIENVRNSDLPNKDELLRKMTDDLDELTAKAKENYLEAERRYGQVRDLAVGNILLAMRGEAPQYGTAHVVSLTNWSREGAGSDISPDEEVIHLSSEQVQRLRKEIYSIFGAEPPENFKSDGTSSDGTEYRFAEVDSTVNLPGRKLVERRNKPKGQLNSDLYIGLERA